MRYYEIEKKLHNWKNENAVHVANVITNFCIDLPDFIDFIDFVKKIAPIDRHEHIGRFLAVILFIYETDFDNEIIEDAIERGKDELSYMTCYIYLNQQEILNRIYHEPTAKDLFEKGGIVSDIATPHHNEHIFNSTCLNIPVSLGCSNEDASLGKIGDRITLTDADYKTFIEALKQPPKENELFTKFLNNTTDDKLYKKVLRTSNIEHPK